jgi:hypothetical protein
VPVSAPVFKATFSDFRLVKTRSCAQLIFEVPIEEADAALQTLGGLPRAATEVWAGIARIDPKNPAPEPRNAPDKASAPKERRPFNSLALPAQAAMRCNEPEFQRFIADRLYGPGNDVRVESPMAASEVRHICGVTSRSMISIAGESGRKWLALDAEYLEWKHTVPYESAR